MIDLTRGTFSFDRHNLLVGPKFTEQEFVRSSIGHRAAPLVRNGDHSSWNVRELRVAGQEVAASFYFRGGSLWQVHICLCDDDFGQSWDDWSEEKELARKAEHDQWLARTLGSARRFSWGSVTSCYDAKTGGSSIVVALEEDA